MNSSNLEKILVIDTGLGNLGSISNMFKHIGHDTYRSSSLDSIRSSSKIILPGVGSFDAGMRSLHEANIVETLKEVATNPDVKIMGICLGMQLLFDSSEEGQLEGLGLIGGEIIRFRSDSADIKVPHMGWNTVSIQDSSSLLNDKNGELRFYFVHSYHTVCSDENDVLGMTHHGIKFASVVKRDNVMGVQFHPEKSHRFGMSLLKSFAEM